VLKEAGLVTDRAEGTRRIYGVDVIGIAALRDYAKSFWSAAMTRYARAAEWSRAAAPAKGRPR
jgi:hypothetical protein